MALANEPGLPKIVQFPQGETEQNAPVTSLEVCESITYQDLQNLTKIMSGQLRELLKGVTPANIRRVAKFIFDSFPIEFRRTINREATMEQLVSTLSIYANEPEKIMENEERVVMALTNVFREQGLVSAMTDERDHTNRVYADRAQLTEIQSPNRISRGTKEAIQNILYMASAATTFMGVQILAGSSMDYIEKEVGFGMDARIQIGLRLLIGLLGAVGVSQVVLNVKKQIEYRAALGNMGVFKAIRTFLGERPAYAAIASVILLADIATNISGAVALYGQEQDKKAQVTEAKRDVSARVDTIKTLAEDGVKDIKSKTATNVSNRLNNEYEGKGTTGMEGEGPVYWALNYLYNEDLAALAKLKERANEEGDRGKLAKNLIRSIENGGVINGKSFQKEVEEALEKAMARITAKIEAINRQKDSITPSMQIETIKEELDRIIGDKENKGMLQECLDILNEELGQSLKEILGRHSKVEEGIARVAISSGRYDEKKTNPKELAGWELPKVKGDNNPINIENIQFKSPITLIQEVVDKNSALYSALIILLASLYGVFVSHLDQCFFGRTRKATQGDAEKAGEGRDGIMKELFNSLVNITYRFVNNAEFSRYFNGQRVERGVIAVEMGGLFQELIEEESGQRTRKDSMTNTEVAQTYNDEVRAMHRFLNGGQEMVARLLQRLTPAPAYLPENSGGRRDLNSARRYNDESLLPKNQEAERRMYARYMDALNAAQSPREVMALDERMHQYEALTGTQYEGNETASEEFEERVAERLEELREKMCETTIENIKKATTNKEVDAILRKAAKEPFFLSGTNEEITVEAAASNSVHAARIVESARVQRVQIVIDCMRKATTIAAIDERIASESDLRAICSAEEKQKINDAIRERILEIEAMERSRNIERINGELEQLRNRADEEFETFQETFAHRDTNLMYAIRDRLEIILNRVLDILNPEQQDNDNSDEIDTSRVSITGRNLPTAIGRYIAEIDYEISVENENREAASIAQSSLDRNNIH